MDTLDKFKYKEVHKAFARLNIHTPTREDEHRWLYERAYHAAFEFERARIVEYGTMNGSTAITMGMALEYAKGIAATNGQTLDAELVSVDNYHAHYHGNSPLYVSPEQVRENILACGLQCSVTTIEMDDLEHMETLEDGSIGMAFIDALHTYNRVKKSAELLLPKMARNSMFSGHDYVYDCYGVIYAVEEIMEEYKKHLCGFSVCNKIWWTIVREPVVYA